MESATDTWYFDVVRASEKYANDLNIEGERPPPLREARSSNHNPTIDDQILPSRLLQLPALPRSPCRKHSITLPCAQVRYWF